MIIIPKILWIIPVYAVKNLLPAKRAFPPIENRNRTIKTPAEYERVTKTIPKLTVLVTDNAAIVDKIGPAHGDQTIPRDIPVTKPGIKPFDGGLGVILISEDNREKPNSKIPVNLGITSVSPRKVKTITANSLKISGSKLKKATRYDIVSVKKAKLATIPSEIPNAFVLPPVEVVENIIGKRGQMQGARIVTKPEIKANKRRISINYFRFSKTPTLWSFPSSCLYLTTSNSVVNVSPVCPA